MGGETLSIVAEPSYERVCDAIGGDFGFLGGEALRPPDRLSEAALQLEAPAAPRRLRLHLIRPCQLGEQRLRLGDLGHFRRRRKALEGRRKNGVGFDGTTGRLVELGER